MLQKAHEAAGPFTPTAAMSPCQSHQHQLARPIKNRLMRERSRFVSSWKKHADLRKLSFQQAVVGDTNSILVQTENRFVAFP
jgi:hypothetical protein